jgi:hypothetical protein
MDRDLVFAVAVLQANLKLLEDEQGALSDLSDMQALRKLRADLGNFISSQASIGVIPSDPLGHIWAQLHILDKAFTRVENEVRAILSRTNYFSGDVPAVSESDLHEEKNAIQSIRDTLSELPDALRASLDALDPELQVLSWNGQRVDICEQMWAISRAFPDLSSFADRDQCSACLDYIYKLVPNNDIVVTHLEALSSRIEKLVKLHADHRQKLESVNGAIRRGDIHLIGAISSLATTFSDISTASALKAIDKMRDTLKSFKNLEELAKAGDWKQLASELEAKGKEPPHPASQIGRECKLAFDNATQALAAERRRAVVLNIIVYSVGALIFAVCVTAMYQSGK